MIVRERVILSPYTSLSVGGPARFFVEATSEQDVSDAVDFAAREHLPILPLGGGTNVLVPDAGVEAVVLSFGSGHFSCTPAHDTNTLLVADAGVSWDALVDAAAAQDLWGIENLAGIPGRAAGALVQNIGAYGVEFSSVFTYADVFDCGARAVRHISRSDAHLAYRTSLFKEDHTLIILRIALTLSGRGTPQLAYADLVRAQEAGVVLSTPRDIVKTVRSIRAAKFPQRPDSTAGSFFKNPIVSGEQARALQKRFPGLPVYPESSGRIKLSLAWLLDHALGLKGFTEGHVRLFEKQPIVLVALPGATAREIDTFACSIERRVHDELSIRIEREVALFDAAS